MRVVLAIFLLVVIGVQVYQLVLTHRYTEPVTIATVDTVMIRTIKNYRTCIDSLRAVKPVIVTKWLREPARIDTVEVNNYVYDIPIIPYMFLDSLPVLVNKQEYYVPFDLMIDGYVTEYSIGTREHEFNIKPVTRFSFRNVAIGSVAIGLTVFVLVSLFD